MAYTQAERFCSVTSPVAKVVLLLRHLTGHEAISGLFRYDLELLSETGDIKFDQIIGKSLTVRLSLPGGSERFFNGVVSRFSQGATEGRFVAYHAEVVPWLWLLTRSSNCRIFQNKTIPDIIKDVFEGLGFRDFELKLGSGYEKRTYCVQYRETDFNFVSRLMEEEGISYFFKQEEKKHTLVLFDSPDANAECPGQKEVTYATAVGEDRPTGDIEDWQVRHELLSGNYAITDYDFESPSDSLMATTKSSINVGGNEKYEIYDYPGEYTELKQGDARVKKRMEAEEAASIVIQARSSCGAFSPGYRFDLKGHYRKDFSNKAYLLTQVTHSITQGVGDEGSGGSSYSNGLTCIPHSVPYRPLQTTPKPIITGVQTATVVGASGEEIDVDKYGRVVVQFHWDREGKRDENSSCRVRVAQNWAGKNWGAITHPRIGQEVIVEFLEGDPDRPIITGRVYNAEQMPPYELPANKTQSGIKSRSSKSGDTSTFNEIRMEDKKGEELFYVHAEKDRQKMVENDETEEIGHDRARKVGNDEQIRVENNRALAVGGNHSVSVEKDHSETIDGNETLAVSKDRDRSVSGKEAISVSDDRSLNVGGDESIKIEKSQIIAITKDQSRTVEGGHSSKITKEYGLKAKEIQLEADDKITLKTGSAELVMEKSGDIMIKGSKIQIKGSGDVIIKGSKIKEN